MKGFTLAPSGSFLIRIWLNMYGIFTDTMRRALMLRGVKKVNQPAF